MYHLPSNKWESAAIIIRYSMTPWCFVMHGLYWPAFIKVSWIATQCTFHVILPLPDFGWPTLFCTGGNQSGIFHHAQAPITKHSIQQTPPVEDTLSAEADSSKHYTSSETEPALTPKRRFGFAARLKTHRQSMSSANSGMFSPTCTSFPFEYSNSPPKQQTAQSYQAQSVLASLMKMETWYISFTIVKRSFHSKYLSILDCLIHFHVMVEK